MNEETVTISKAEYDKLYDAAEWLSYLERAGLSANQLGFDEVIRLRQEDEELRRIKCIS